MHKTRMDFTRMVCAHHSWLCLNLYLPQTTSGKKQPKFFNGLCFNGCEQPPSPMVTIKEKQQDQSCLYALPVGEHHKPGGSSSEMEEDVSSELPHAPRPGAEGAPGTRRLCQHRNEGWRRYLSGLV